MFTRNHTAAVAAFLAAVLTAGPAAAQAFQFAAIGDTGYSKKSEEEFSRMLAAMNREPLAFVVHVGDFEADPRPYMRSPTTVTEPCTDESFKSVLAQFQQSAHPFILTPGDNDWTDCHILKSRKVDPLERLAKLREMFYPQGVSLGKRTMPVESQASDPKFSKFRENLAWTAEQRLVRDPAHRRQQQQSWAARPRWIRRPANGWMRTSPGCAGRSPTPRRRTAPAS